jgi:hypothetical protein
MRIVIIRNTFPVTWLVRHCAMIISTVSGRIRVRAPRLKNRQSAEAVRSQAAAIDGVTRVRVNPGAGSLVVTYDTRAVDTDALEERLEALCLAPAPKSARPARRTLSRHLNRATKVGMMTTLATSLAYGYLGKKKAHIGFGAAFVAFAGLHMLRYQATLVR